MGTQKRAKRSSSIVDASDRARTFLSPPNLADQLKTRLNLNTDHLVRLEDEAELKAEVDSAIVSQIVNPLRMKSHLVTQLKAQITDLEMFIGFLQSETSVAGTLLDGCGGCG